MGTPSIFFFLAVQCSNEACVGCVCGSVNNTHVFFSFFFCKLSSPFCPKVLRAVTIIALMSNVEERESACVLGVLYARWLRGGKCRWRSTTAHFLLPADAVRNPRVWAPMLSSPSSLKGLLILLVVAERKHRDNVYVSPCFSRVDISLLQALSLSLVWTFVEHTETSALPLPSFLLLSHHFSNFLSSSFVFSFSHIAHHTLNHVRCICSLLWVHLKENYFSLSLFISHLFFSCLYLPQYRSDAAEASPRLARCTC